MSRDWHAWYRDYDDPTSHLASRLKVVKAQLRAVLEAAQEPVTLLGLCSGDGRDTIPVIDAVQKPVTARLVELDPLFSAMARESSAALGLTIEVLSTDAGTTDCAVGIAPADVVMACGIFGNVTDRDVERTVRTLPSLLKPGGVVIWTRRHRAPEDPEPGPGEPADHARKLFADAGYEEVAFVEPEEHPFRVGVHRWPGPAVAFEPGVRMFDFL